MKEYKCIIIDFDVQFISLWAEKYLFLFYHSTSSKSTITKCTKYVCTNNLFSTFPLGYTTEKRIYLWPFYSIVASPWKSFWKRSTLLLFREIQSPNGSYPTTENTIWKAKAGLKEKDIASLPFSFGFSLFSAFLSFFHNATSIWARAAGYAFAAFIEVSFLLRRYQRSVDPFILSAALRRYHNENGARTQVSFCDIDFFLIYAESNPFWHSATYERIRESGADF